MNDEMREAFEAWANSGEPPYDLNYDLNFIEADIYVMRDTQNAYIGFQAAYQIQQSKLDKAIEALAQIATTEKMTWQEKEKLPYNWAIAQQALAEIRGEG